MLRSALRAVSTRRPASAADADDGAVAVEFALVLPILVLFLFGILQFGLFFFRIQGMQAVALEGARGGSVGLTVQEITARIQASLTVPVSYADLDIQVLLVNTTTATVVTNIDAKAASPAELATAPCEGIVDADEHVLRVELTIDPSLQEYQVIIPVWGTLGINYGVVGSYACENTA